jgi:hypothetical protein
MMILQVCRRHRNMVCEALGVLSRYYDDGDGDARDNDADFDDADPLNDDVGDVSEEGALARSVPGLRPPARVRKLR